MHSATTASYCWRVLSIRARIPFAGPKVAAVAKASHQLPGGGALHIVHPQLTLALRFDLAAPGEGEPGHVLDQFVGTLADVHTPHITTAFHAARDVHGIAPDVVLEFLH